MSVAGLKAVVRQHVLGSMVGSVNKGEEGASKWRVMVVDSVAVRTINAAVRMTELTDADITLIESLEKRRTAYPTMDAIYCCAATQENISRIIEDERPICSS